MKADDIRRLFLGIAGPLVQAKVISVQDLHMALQLLAEISVENLNEVYAIILQPRFLEDAMNDALARKIVDSTEPGKKTSDRDH